MKANPVAHFAAALIALATACGGEPEPNVTVSKLQSVGPDGPAAIVHSKSGDTISYFAAPGAKVPSQALLTTKAGDAIRSYYAADGSLQKIVDDKTGSYIVVKARDDGSGADYLAYDSNGAFNTGVALYRSGGDWYTAKVVGELGQLTGNLAGAINASFAVKASEASHAATTKLSANLDAVMNNSAKLSARSPLLSLLVRSAYAQTVTNGDKATLYSGAALSIVGALVFLSPTPEPLSKWMGVALMGAGATQVWRGLTGIVDRNLDSIDAATTGAMENRAAADLDAGIDPIRSIQSTVQTIADKGLVAIAAAAPNLDRTSGPIPDVAVPSSQPDDTPPAGPLPQAMGDNTSLVGTTVDASNSIYPTTGTIDSSGSFSVSGTSASGVTISVSGTADATSNSVAGNYQQRGPTGAVLASGSVVGGALGPLGQCASTTQSGGLGTFSYAFDLGRNGGTFDLTYDMFSIPDALSIVVGNRMVFSTGGLVSGSQSISVPYSGGDTAFVNVSAPNTGTAWEFTIGCAN